MQNQRNSSCAGKGHEEQQIYKNKILNISDKKIIKILN